MINLWDRMFGKVTKSISIPVGSPPGSAIDSDAERILGLSAKRPTSSEKPKTFANRMEQIKFEEAKAFERSLKFQAEQKQLATDAAMFGTRNPKSIRVYERLGLAPMPPEFLRSIGAQLSAEDAEALRLAAAAYAKLREFMNEFLDNKVSASIAAEKERYRLILLEGETPDFTPKNYTEKKAEFQGFIQVIMRELGHLYISIVPILQAHVEKTIEAATAKADKLEAEERAAQAENSTKFGWEFRPSPELIALRQCVWRLPSMVALTHTGHNPKTAAQNIGIEI
jgi:hypothetical protein